MADCPCGCGRRVPLLKGGAAKFYPHFAFDLEMVNGALQSLPDSAPMHSMLAKLSKEGEFIQSQLLDHLHKRAKPQTHLNLLEITRRYQQWSPQAKRHVAHVLDNPEST